MSIEEEIQTVIDKYKNGTQAEKATCAVLACAKGSKLSGTIEDLAHECAKFALFQISEIREHLRKHGVTP